MEARYMIEGEKETSITEVDFVNFYPFNVTIFIRYIKGGQPGEIILNVESLKYFKVYKD